LLGVSRFKHFPPQQTGVLNRQLFNGKKHVCNMETMIRRALITLAVAISIFFVAAPFAAAQNATPAQAPLQSTQPAIVAAIGAAAAVLFFVLLYKMKTESADS